MDAKLDTYIRRIRQIDEGAAEGDWQKMLVAQASPTTELCEEDAAQANAFAFNEQNEADLPEHRHQFFAGRRDEASGRCGSGAETTGALWRDTISSEPFGMMPLEAGTQGGWRSWLIF